MPDISIMNMTIGGNWKGVPIGPLKIVSNLEIHGFSADFRDYQIYDEQHKTNPDSCLKFLNQTASDIVGCGVLCSSLPTVLLAVQKLKEERPDKTVILGGPSATDTPTEIMEHFPVDIIVIGEGEETIVEVMEALDGEKELKDVAGIAYRDNGRIVVNPRRKRIEDLDSLPFPAYHKIDFKDYGAEGIILTMRGCPFKCTFCSAHSVWQRKVTYRHIANIIEEIQLIEDQINSLTFADDTLVLRKNRLFELCNAMKEEKIDLKWRCTGRVDRVSVDLLKKLSSHNCQRLYFGIESGSDRVLKKIHKDFSSALSRTIIDTASQYLKVITSYMWGFPFETLEDFYDTMLQLTRDMKNSNVEPMLTFLSPLPQAPITCEYFNLIKFSENVRSGMAALPKEDDITCYSSLMDIIQKHPGIFTVFYYFEHPDYQKKKEIVDKLIEKEVSISTRESIREVSV